VSRRQILVLHGPNLNRLGKREVSVYGKTTLATIDRELRSLGKKLGYRVLCKQTNGEGQMVDILHESEGSAAGIIINPAAYTHTSIAIRDALASLSVPVIEVHLSNIFAREKFRRKSLVSPVVRGTISGFGAGSYRLALAAMAELLKHGTD
jgi:3-dehydroquinate dehydratase-2